MAFDTSQTFEKLQLPLAGNTAQFIILKDIMEQILAPGRWSQAMAK